MKIAFIPPDQFTLEQADRLASVTNAGGDEGHRSADAILDAVQQGTVHAYSTSAKGLFILSVHDNGLTRWLELDAFTAKDAGFHFRSFVSIFRGLLDHYNCRKVLTTVYDRRLRAALAAVGVQTTGWVMELDLS